MYLDTEDVASHKEKALRHIDAGAFLICRAIQNQRDVEGYSETKILTFVRTSFRKLYVLAQITLLRKLEYITSGCIHKILLF